MAKKERKLSPAELRRKEEFEAKALEFERQGYEKRNLTIGIVEANVLAIVIMMPIVVLMHFLYAWMNKEGVVIQFGPIKGLLYFLLAFAFIVIHELIHGITWGCMTKEHFKSIEFGVIWSAFTPYCTCKEELKKRQYLIGAMMPTIFVGVIPALIGIISNNVMLYLIGQLMIIGGGGDALIMLKLLLHKENGKDCIYMDHPYECGLIAFERTKSK